MAVKAKANPDKPARGRAPKKTAKAKAAPKKAVKKAAPKRSAPKKAAPKKKAVAKKAAPKKAVAKKAAPKKSVPKKAAPKKSVPKKAAPKKAASKKPAAKRSVAKKAPPKKTASKKPAAKRSVAKKAPPKKTRALAETAPTPAGVRRRDGGGRVDPEYQAELLAKSGHNTDDKDDRAFLDRPESEDPAVEELGETFLHNVTSGLESDDEGGNPNDPDEEGGPYVVTTAAEEFGREPDESNPEDAEPAPFPITQSES